ncbi:MAG TPA: S9 family peptidase [Gammaproteobacteria bacterium]|nr:S9 family peptidase [Gammaproteobacteria bacterium]
MFRKFSLGLVFSLACSAVFAADGSAQMTSSPASTGAIPVQTFFTYAKISAAKISPDGKYIAVAAANEKTGLEKNLLVIISLADMKAAASFNMIGDDSIQNFWWANDERVLVAGETKSGSLDHPQGNGKLYAVNVDGTQQRQLLPVMSNYRGNQQLVAAQSSGGGGTMVYFWGILYHDPVKDPRHIIFQGAENEGSAYAQRPKAFELDVYTGQIRKVATGGEAQGTLVADNDGAVRITEGEDANGHSVIAYRPDGESVNWRDISSLFAGEDPAQVESRALGFAADNKHFYWLGRTKESTLGLYLVDPDTLAKQPLFEDPEFDVNRIVWSFRENGAEHPVAVDTLPGLPKVNVIDADDPEVDYIAQLYDAFPGQDVYITSYTRDHKKMIVATRSDKDPGEFYLYDTAAHQVRLLFQVKPDIDPAKMAAMLPITLTARDGVVLHGYLTLPPGSSGKDLPLIVNPHGGPHGPRDEWGFDPEVQLFANRGYAVLQLNYRGSGGYGLRFEQLGYRHWSSTMQDDLADAVNWAIKQGYADANRVCIYGASYGGYAAFENPIRYPNLYKCAFGYVGAYDLTLLGEKGDVSHFAGGANAMDVYLGADMDERKRESPAYNADKLTIPVMIAYGGADVRVVPEHAKNMMAALDKAGRKYPDPVYYPNEAHGFTDQDHNFALYTKMLAFFDKYIGPDAAKSGMPAATGAAGSKH